MTPDGDLVSACLDGRTDAFRALVDRYGRSVSGYLRSRSIPADQVDDLTQDVFLKAYQSLTSLGDRASFAGWLFAIARNRAFDWFRGRSRQPRPVADDGAEAVDPGTGPLGHLDRVERGEAVRRAIAGLPEVYRTTLYLKHQEGHPCREIAAIQGVGIGTVTKRLSRAYSLLRQRLEADGLAGPQDGDRP